MLPYPPPPPSSQEFLLACVMLVIISIPNKLGQMMNNRSGL